MRSLANVGVWIGLIAWLAVACGDDATQAARSGEAGAAGEASEPGAAGAGTTPVGGGGEGGAPAAASIDLATFCQEVSQRYGAWLANCYGSSSYSVERVAELADENEARCLLSRSSVEAERLSFDGTVAAACVELLDATNCNGFEFLEGLPICRNVFAPLVEPGGECFPGAVLHFSIGGTSECLDGYCDVTGQVCPGECAPLKPDDGECQSSSECLPESYCGDGVCTPRPGAGEACSGDACGPDASCITEPQAAEGVCVPRSTVGQACSGTEPCSFGYYCLQGKCLSKVESGETCVQTRNCPDGELCLDRDADGPDAATCGAAGGLDVPCFDSAHCDADHYCPFGADMVCTARIALQDPCTAEQRCVIGGWCNLETGACQAVGAEGDSCLMNGFPADSSACGPELKCMSNGECHALGAESDPCSTNDVTSCESGLFCAREDFTCHAPAAEGELCNPFSPTTCAGDLACLCDDPACTSYGGNPLVTDTLHTCLPRRQVGDACLSSNECAVGDHCVGGTPMLCASFDECLPP